MANNPTLLTMPLAQNGQKNVIPETQATAGDGLFSQSTGFPAETSLPLGAGGVAPSREDFNGLANLLGGVAFMAQKGFTFNYDATQDYYTGCVVIDNGNRYLCVADMTAGTIAPSADTTGDYWIFYPVGVINKRDEITTSGTYTAPVTGWYRITVKGGGGGGGASFYLGGGTQLCSGGGGGEGGTTIGYEKMTAGQTAAVVIGAGGTGGEASTVDTATNGGNSVVTVNSNTYTGGGGGKSENCHGGKGGTGTIPGAPGNLGLSYASTVTLSPGTGGGNGGGSFLGSVTGVKGGGGGGGVFSNASPYYYAGGNGGNGYVWFEYFDGSLN